MGGIGDQIFQYSYANYLRNKFRCNAYLDTSYYSNEFNYNKFKFRLSNLAKKNNFKIVGNITYINFKFISYLRLIELFKINKIFSYIYRLFFKTPIQNFIYEFWETKKKVNKECTHHTRRACRTLRTLRTRTNCRFVSITCMPSMIPDLAVRAAKSLPNSVMNEEMGANVPENQ